MEMMIVSWCGMALLFMPVVIAVMDAIKRG